MDKFSYFLFSLFLFIADQLSKWAVTEHMIRSSLGEAFGEPHRFFEWLGNPPPRLPFASIEILPFFNIVMVWNKGVSFGLFNNDSDLGPLLLSGLSLVIAVIFIIWLLRCTSQFQCVAIALVISGAIGNIVDRIRFDAVVDFIDLHAFGYHYPAFNIADSCIVVGVGLLIIHSLFFDRSGKSTK